MLRRALLTAAGSARLRRVVEDTPLTRGIVERYVAGTDVEDALRTARALHDDGLLVALNHLGEDAGDRLHADAARNAYVVLLERLADAGLAESCEASVKLSALGRGLTDDGDGVALDNARLICEAAKRAGATVTLDMEDHTTVDATLAAAGELRPDFPWIGVVLQAYLRRTEADCRDAAGAGARVRLVKGAYDEPASVAYRSHSEVDRAYVRCLRILMAGQGYPMVATHDPRLVEIAGALAVAHRRERGSHEYQMLYGVRPDEQRRLVATGERVRIYVPYGREWYGYLVRRLAERPANLTFFLRSLAGRG